VNKNTAFLLNEGYQLGRLQDKKHADDDLPVESIVVSDGKGASQVYVATSTRVMLIGREIPGGPLGEDCGIICGEDIRSDSRSENTLGGGRVEAFMGEFRAEGDTEAEESVLDCLFREVEAELGLKLVPDSVMLVGVRMISEKNSRELKRINSKICVDAYFAGIVDERLSAFRAKDGEVGNRRVLSPEELLGKPKWGERNMLPQTQRLALATGIITTSDLFENSLPEYITKMLRRSLPLARSVYRSSPWIENFMPLIQQ